MEKLFIYLLLFYPIVPLKAQVTQIELHTGLHKTSFDLFSIQPLDLAQNFSVAIHGLSDKYERIEDKIFDVVIIQGTIFWNFTQGWSIGTALNFNSSLGFKKKLCFF